jgi:hypothetical protein
MSRAQVQAFFEAYRDAFNRLDGDAVADLWHGASGIADSRDACGRVTWWPEDTPMRANHHALCDHYRQAGYGHADFELLAHEPMGADHAFARVRWTLHRTDGALLQRFATGYQLMRTVDGPKVLLCTAYEEDLQEMKSDVAP